MKKIILIGAGGHAAELRDYIRYQNENTDREKIEVVGFIDDDQSTYDHYGFEEPFLGDVQNHEVRSDVEYLMGIANLKFRREIIQNFNKKGAEITGFIHPTALISPSAEIGDGVVISHNASVGPKVKIGNYNILNSRCTIGHDTVLGDFNFVSPQVALSGNTVVGNENLLGTNAATTPGVKIGNNNLIGAGAIVIKDVPDGVTVVGNKARIIS
jgi:acetyltransferase EpsM